MFGGLYMRNIPKYIQEIMERAQYNFDNKNANPGYTVDIVKRSHQEWIGTFQDEINRLVKWVNANCGYDNTEEVPCIEVLYIPKETKYKRMQYATVTIYDPVMKYLEKYINTTKPMCLV